MNKPTTAKEDQEARMVKEREERSLKRKVRAGKVEHVKTLKKKQKKNKWAIAINLLVLFIISSAGYLYAVK